MEVGLKIEIPTYSGGLGVLAGDTLKTAADLGKPVVGMTLFYNKGYFNQNISQDGWQEETYPKFDPSSQLERITETVTVNIEGRTVNVGAWKYTITGNLGHLVPVYFLDTSNCGNPPHDETHSQSLYSGDHLYHRLCQEVILGIGGVRMLRKLGYDPEVYHMNEGHAAFLTLELLKESNYNKDAVKERCVFTTHTPVKAGHDVFGYELSYNVLKDMLPENIRELAGHDRLSMTQLALNLSRYINAVSKKHGEVSSSMFPEHNIDYITNGVHSPTWTSPPFQALYDKYIPEWRTNPQALSKAGIIPLEEIDMMHKVAKRTLIDMVYNETNTKLNPNLLTIGFARRAAAYKRSDLVFSDMERLREIGKGKIQFVYAGKAHPRDGMGKELIWKVIKAGKSLKNDISVIYLPNYNMRLGAILTAGVDLWLNTPERPREASGTSGMKAVHNGNVNFSVLDGWWIEGHIEGVTGWSIGPKPTESSLEDTDYSKDSEDLYTKLEKTIIPTYYNNINKWLEMKRNAIAKNASFFNTHRMLKEYFKRAYKI